MMPASALVPCSLCGQDGYNDQCQRCITRMEIADDDDFRSRHDDWEKENQLTVAIVGCSKQKKPVVGPAPAWELYTGRLARMGYSYAVAKGWCVYFVSAAHGLLEPGKKISPYDMSLGDLKSCEREDWGRSVVSDLIINHPLIRLRLVFLAGEIYIRPIMEAAHHQVGYWSYEHPLKGLDLFARMRWFKAHCG